MGINEERFNQIQSLFYESKGHNLMRIVDSIKHEFSNIDTQRKTLKSWIKDYSDLYMISKVILYHGTSEEHDIEKEGIKKTSSRTRKSLQSSSGFVSLSLYPSHAEMFGKIAYPHDDIKIYAVEVPVQDLLADKDQIFNQKTNGAAELSNTLVDSLLFGSGARIRRDVKPYELADVSDMFLQQESYSHQLIR